MKNVKITDKFNKQVKKGTCFALSMLMVGMLSGKVKANDEVKLYSSKEITLNVSTGVNIYINDQSFLPTDVNGNETYPFIFNGTTYLPARSISETFSADVKWDGTQRRVDIIFAGVATTPIKKGRTNTPLKSATVSASTGVQIYVNGVLLEPKDANFNPVEVYIINGTTYLPLRTLANAFGVEIFWEGETNSVYLGDHALKNLPTNKDYYYIWPNQPGYIQPNSNYSKEELASRYFAAYESWKKLLVVAKETKENIPFKYTDFGYMDEYIEYQENGCTIAQKYIDLEIEVNQEIYDTYVGLSDQFDGISNSVFKHYTEIYDSLKVDKNSITKETMSGSIIYIGNEINEINGYLYKVSPEKDQEYIKKYDAIHEQFKKELVSLYGNSKQITM